MVRPAFEGRVYFHRTGGVISSLDTIRESHLIGNTVHYRTVPKYRCEQYDSVSYYDFESIVFKVVKIQNAYRIVVDKDEINQEIQIQVVGLGVFDGRNLGGSFKQFPLPHKPAQRPTHLKKGLMNILYVISNTQIGGAETVLKRLIRGLDKSLYEVDVIVTGMRGPLHAEYAANSSSLTYSQDEGVYDINLWIITKAKEKQYDLIHFFNLFRHYAVIPIIKANSPYTKIVATLLVDLYYFKESWKNEIRLINTIRKHLWAFTADAYINKKVFPELTIIPNGIPTTMFSSGHKKPKTVVWIGRMIAGKKIRLIPQIARLLPDYQFTIIGDKQTPEYRKLIEPGGINAPNVTYKIGLNERQVADILAESQYMIFTSHSEALPLVVLEAMSSGCCVVSERVGDIPRVIQHGVNGYLVPEGSDTVDWISKNLGNLNINVSDAARKKIIGAYSEDQMTKKYEFLYGAIGSHHNQTRIAFLWGVPQFHEGFWEGKLDSMQHAISELSTNNVVQVFASTNKNPSRNIVNGQNIYFYEHDNTKDLVHILKRFNPHMIYLNMFGDKKWSEIVNAFPKTWKAVMHYGATNLKIPYANKMDLVIVQQEYMVKKIVAENSLPPEKVKACPFCIEQWLFKPTATQKPYSAIMVADFRKDIKRQDLLIRAWKDIPGKLVLVGRFERSIPEDYHETCIALVKKLGLENRIEILNGYPHNELPALINKAKIAVLTSKREAGSRALIEMMGCGLPALVLSDCPGNVNMIKREIDGLASAPDPKSIAEAAKRLLENYQKMGENASKRIIADYPYHKMYSFFKKMVEKARPEVSIITTSMNRGEYIEDTINSVKTQRVSFPVKVNHIIMDGGSKDNTLSILEKHRDSVHAFIKRDKGQTDAICKAMQIVEQEFPQTEYVGWINADDYYEPSYLENSLTQLRDAPPDVAMTCGDANLVGMQSGVIHYTSQRYVTTELIGTRGNIVVQPTVLIRLSALKKMKEKQGYSFNPEIDYVQDLELWYRLLINGYRIKHLTKDDKGLNVVANLRMHPEQMSRTHAKQQTIERDKILRAICIKEGIEGPPWVKH